MLITVLFITELLKYALLDSGNAGVYLTQNYIGFYFFECLIPSSTAGNNVTCLFVFFCVIVALSVFVLLLHTNLLRYTSETYELSQKCPVSPLPYCSSPPRPPSTVLLP